MQFPWFDHIDVNNVQVYHAELINKLIAVDDHELFLNHFFIKQFFQDLEKHNLNQQKYNFHKCISYSNRFMIKSNPKQ